MIHEMEINVDYGLFLKTRRKAKGLTQQQVSEKAGYHITSISRWERGEQFPRMDELENLLEVLDAELVIRDKGKCSRI